MQPIERYGLVALVFLGITITAACMWDPDEDSAGTKPAASELARKDQASEPAPPGRRDFVGARTKETPRGEPRALSASQRQELLALQGRTDPTGGGNGSARPGGTPAGPGRALLGDAFAPIPEQDLAQPEVSPEPLHRDPTPIESGKPGKSTKPLDSGRPVAPGTRVYEIQGSDTLSEISMRELGTWKRWQEIVDLNPGLDPNHLRAGARIKLPAKSSTATREPESPRAGSTPEKTAATGPTHEVQENESLWKIAAARLGAGERWTEIAALNPDVDPNRLKAGMKLVLPSNAARPSAGSAASAAPAAVASSERPTTGKVR